MSIKNGETNTEFDALAVGEAQSDQDALARIFREQQWGLSFSPTISESRDRLVDQQIPVIICEACLPDGGWDHLFGLTETLPAPPVFIVTSRLADEDLWCTALNLGAFDVLCTPFERREVAHVVRCAWDSWRNRDGKRKRTDAGSPPKLRGMGAGSSPL